MTAGTIIVLHGGDHAAGDDGPAPPTKGVAAELADGATPLPRLQAAQTSTVLLGREHHGVPDPVLADVDECVEIPMTGWGASLNVAVVGSLVLYRLAGLS